MPSGFTYKWQSAIDLVSKMVKGMPTSAIDAMVCDQVSSEMYRFWPWSYTLTTGILIPTLTDGTQDYSQPAGGGVYRLLSAWILRTDTTPNQAIDLDVRQTLTVDLVPKSYTAIRALSNEAGIGQLRLDSAVSVASGVTLRIDGRWQPIPTKIAATSQDCWFPDQYLSIAAEGLLYWYYKVGDDPRAGGKQTNKDGRTVYIGQYAAFRDALEEMAASEDYPSTDQLFPDEPMGLGRGYYGTLNIYGSN